MLYQLALLLTGTKLALGAEFHGQNAAGKTMGPVAFMWPADRPWAADADNIAPCGSSAGVTNRTSFPLTAGTVSLSIADDAWNVAFSIAYDNDPKAQSDFTQQVVNNVTAIEAGHQCYKVAQVPSTVTAGTNATIQLEYWSNVESELGGRNQSFYACADITFVEVADFKLNPPCLNVTASTFDLAPKTTTGTTLPTSTGSTGSTGSTNSETTPVNSASSSDGLSTGAKAGVAVGVIVASLGIVGAVAFLVLRKRKSRQPDHENGVHNIKAPETASVNSLRH